MKHYQTKKRIKKFTYWFWGLTLTTIVLWFVYIYCTYPLVWLIFFHQSVLFFSCSSFISIWSLRWKYLELVLVLPILLLLGLWKYYPVITILLPFKNQSTIKYVWYIIIKHNHFRVWIKCCSRKIDNGLDPNSSCPISMTTKKTNICG